MNKKEKQKAAWALLSAGSAALTGLLVFQALSRSYKAYYSDEPPQDPTVGDFSWLKAMTWTAGTAAVVGMAQMAAVRGAAIGWKKTTGKLPPSS